VTRGRARRPALRNDPQARSRRAPPCPSVEEALCLALLDDDVVVQPGFFYDFERPGHLVVSLSLLPRPEELAEGIRRVLARCANFVSPSAR
jgi:hypothetical protein